MRTPGADFDVVKLTQTLHNLQDAEPTLVIEVMARLEKSSTESLNEFRRYTITSFKLFKEKLALPKKPGTDDNRDDDNVVLTEKTRSYFRTVRVSSSWSDVHASVKTIKRIIAPEGTEDPQEAWQHLVAMGIPTHIAQQVAANEANSDHINNKSEKSLSEDDLDSLESLLVEITEITKKVVEEKNEFEAWPDRADIAVRTMVRTMANDIVRDWFADMFAKFARSKPVRDAFLGNFGWFFGGGLRVPATKLDEPLKLLDRPSHSS